MVMINNRDRELVTVALRIATMTMMRTSDLPDRDMSTTMKRKRKKKMTVEDAAMMMMTRMRRRRKMTKTRMSSR